MDDWLMRSRLRYLKSPRTRLREQVERNSERPNSESDKRPFSKATQGVRSGWPNDLIVSEANSTRSNATKYGVRTWRAATC